MPAPSCTPVDFQGADALRLHREGEGTVIVLRHGGHVVSWRDPSGTERLYLSPISPLDGSAAVRGGVPVIFPQFSTRGPLGRHGFARTQPWQWLEQADAPEAPASMTLALSSSPATLPLWPEAFHIELRVSLAPWVLSLALSVRNTGKRPWAFTGALHSYLAAGPLGAMRLDGLQHNPFEDALASGEQRLASRETLVPQGPGVRIYSGVEEAGPLSVVAINRGAEAGLELGHVLSINRAGRAIKNRLNHVNLNPGDIVLVQGKSDTLQESIVNLGLVPLASRNIQLGFKRSTLIPLILFLLGIILATFSSISVSVCFSLVITNT